MRQAFLLLLLLCFQVYVYGQACEHAGLESGNLSGYETFIGNILSDGTVTIDIPFEDQERHKLMHIDDGIDPIAEMFCDSFNILPVVPPDGGQYALRLGNSDNGAQAERILLTMTVTEDINFFLLRYAVILNDPGHMEFEQPRFELRILDEFGEPFPCGEYSVRAAENIPGFESCAGDWRVRPWTTAGFELQSYIGQTIQIEIMTTDCAQGGHAGYAYIDASCQALDFGLEGFCPGSSSATISVSEGFTSYVWSTGDTTRTITIDDPEPGQEYSVTVTSATGCEITLTDSLPGYVSDPAPEFDLLTDTTLCEGASIEITPTGANLFSVYCVELDQTADEFYVEVDGSASYTFIASDEHGCQFDTATLEVNLSQPSIDTAFLAIAGCNGQATGSILIETSGDVESISWNNGASGPFADNLAAGTYQVLITDAYGCTDNALYELTEPPALEAEVFEITPFTCNNTNDAAVEVFPEGGTPPYFYNWGPTPASTALLSGISPGTYVVTVTDINNCTTEGSIVIPDPPLLEASAIQDSVSCSDGNDGSATVIITGGFPGYTVQWDDSNNQTDITATALSAGTYTVTVTDASNCEVITSIEVLEPLALQITMSADSTSCHNWQDGTATAEVSGGTPGYSYIWNDNQSQITALANGLFSGNYAVEATDQNGCQIIGHVTVPAPPPIQMSATLDSVSCHGGSDGYAIANASGGSPDYFFGWGAPLYKEGPAVANLSAGSYTVEVTDSEGCGNELTIEIEEPAPLIVQPLESFFPDCDNDLPGEAMLDVSGGNGQYEYLWDNGTTESTVTSWEDATFSVTVTDQKDCVAETIVQIETFKMDQEELGLTSTPNFPDPHICLTDSVWISLNYNNELREINWFATAPISCNDCPTVSAMPFEDMTYRVEVIDVNGCPAEVAGQILVDQACSVYVPNAFSPNGDGINDRFYIMGKNGELKIERFQIFNRWGAKVFEGCHGCPIMDPAYGWDGMFNGEIADQGVYVFYVELSFLGDEKPIFYEGDVMLVH